MTTDPDLLGTILREALDADAANAPDMPPGWSDIRHRPAVSAKPTAARRRRARPALVAAAWVATAAAVVGVLVGINDRRSAPAGPASQTLSWTPTGSEFSATDLGPATGQAMGTGVAALTHSISIDDHAPVQVADVIAYTGGSTAEVRRCLWWDDGIIVGGGCDAKPGNSSPHIVAMTTSPPNGDLWIWDGVPTGTAYVAYTDGDITRWQRPVAGIAIFPNEPNTDEIATAYTANGDEVLRVDESITRSDSEATESAVRWADISQDEFDRISRLTDHTAQQCLKDSGATIQGNGLAAFPTEVNSDEVWQACVARTQRVVADELSRLGTAFYDPLTERPQDPEPWMTFTG